MSNTRASFATVVSALIIATAFAVVAAFGIAGTPANAQSPVRFVAHNRDGSTMTCDQFRSIQRNGANDRGWNDALLSAATLEVVELAPVDCSADMFTIRSSGRAGLALSFAWPSPRGYSNVIVDLPITSSAPPLEELLAAQALRDLNAVRSAIRVTTKNSTRLERLRRSVGTSKGTARSAAAWATFDTAVNEHLAILESTGGKANRGWKGVTFRGAPSAADWETAVRATGSGGYVRLVFDLDEPLASYTSAIDAAHERGLRVLGQFADSSQMKRLTADQWTTRVQSALMELPGVDAWEVGSQSNAAWVGEESAARLANAANAVRSSYAAKPTVLTLGWNLGESEIEDSTFNWLKNVSAQTASEISVVGLALYPDDHPMGTAYDRVVRALRTKFPNALIAVTELGYGNDEVAPTWWWGSPSDRAAGRRSVARFYDAASRAHPYGGGGTFWWYFQPEGDVR